MKQIFNLLPNHVYRIKSKISVTVIEIHIVRFETHKEYNSVMNGANYVKYIHRRKRYVVPVINNTFKTPDFKINDKNIFFITLDVDIYNNSLSSVEIERKINSPPCDKKKICYIVSNSCIGGVEKLTIELLKRVTDYHKTIIVTEIKGEFHKEYEKYSDVCLFQNNKGKLKEFVNRNCFDVYHIFNSLIGLDLLDKMDGRVVLSLFGDYTNPGMWFKMRREVFIRNVEFIDIITTDNKKNINILSNFPIHVNNGVEIPKTKIKKSSSNPIVAWVGRNSGEKRPMILYATAKTCKDVSFFVAIGNVYNMEEYSRTIRMLQKLPNVTMWINATEKDVYLALERASIILNTSMMEGMPVALLEGMARGCYPVAPNVGEIAGLIKDIGTIINDLSIHNYSDYIYKALIKCEQEPDLADKIRDRVAEKYDIKNFVNTMNKIYNGYINTDKTPILATANKKKKSKLANLNDRLDAFVNDKPWKIESNIDYARKLYRALFDTELESVPYWFNAVKKGYTRKRITDDFFYISLKINNDGEGHVRIIQKNIIKNLGKYDDDRPHYHLYLDIRGIEDRLQLFIDEKRWEIEPDYEYISVLFKTLFDTDMEKIPYWCEFIKKAEYKNKREAFTTLLFDEALRLEPEDAEFVKHVKSELLLIARGDVR